MTCRSKPSIVAHKMIMPENYVKGTICILLALHVDIYKSSIVRSVLSCVALCVLTLSAPLFLS